MAVGASYRLTVDSAALLSVYGEVLPKTVLEFNARKADEYSAIFFNISGTDGRDAVVELLNKSDEPVASAKVTNGRAELRYLEPATYYARLFSTPTATAFTTPDRSSTASSPKRPPIIPKNCREEKLGHRADMGHL